MSAQGTLTARVVTDRDLREQVTGEGPWGLIRNFEAVREKSWLCLSRMHGV